MLVNDPWFSAGLVALAAFVGGLLPWTRRWSSEGMHRLVALSAGIFVGTALHMAGDLLATGPVDQGFPRRGPAPWMLWSAVAGGFAFLALLERVVLRRWIGHGHAHAPNAGDESRRRHAVLWRASFLGLAVHAFFGGLSLAGLFGSDVWAGTLLFMVLHKLVEAFSLSTVLRLANLRLVTAFAWLLAFALVTPIAFRVGQSFMLQVGPWRPIAVAVAAGTFAYVTLVDLLPEAFHKGAWKDRLPYLIFGAALGGFLPGLHHGHGGGVWDAGASVFVEMAPYLVLGFLAAGFISQLLSADLLRRFLEKDDLRSVATASVVGAPLPLCSCSVVPVAASLRNAGASRGATSAFLVATPETGVDSVAATYALFGPVMAVVRPVAAVFSAIVTGLSVALLGRPYSEMAPVGASFGDEPVEGDAADGAAAKGDATEGDATEGDAGATSCCHAEPEPEPEPEPESSCCHAEGPTDDATGAAPERASRPPLVARALRYAYVDLVDDLAWPLVIGVALSGVLGAFLPESWMSSPSLQGIWGYLFMLAIGLPLYVCAAASTPIAAVLVAKGMSPGAVLVFLLASPATNIGTILVVKKLLGGRGLAVHLVTLAAVTLFCGMLADLAIQLFGLSVPISAAVHDHAHAASTFSLVAAGVLLVVLMASGVRKLGSPLMTPSSVTKAASGG